MSVYKPKASRLWLYDFIIEGERFHGSTGQTSRRAAETVERQKRLEAATGELGVVAKLTLDEAAGRWWKEVGIRRGDAVDVERRVQGLLNIIGRSKRLGDIDQVVVAKAVEERRSQTYAKSPKKGAKRYPVSNSTVNRDIIETLRPILTRARTHWAKRGQHGLADIDWRVLRLREPRALSRLYSEAEQAAWLAACPGETERLALELLLTNGLRFGELFFDPDLLNPDPLEPVLTLQKGRKRDVLLNAPLRVEHGRDLAARASRARAAGLPHVWYDETKKGPVSISYGAMEYRISKAADDAEIKGARRIHGARHHTGSTVMRQTGNVMAVKGVLGHASIASSARYSQMPTADLRKIINCEVSQHSPEADDDGSSESQAG